jgi:hypothetical protein
MKILVSAGALTAALIATGCMNERDYMDPNANAGLGGRSDVNNINLRDGSLRGDFGPRTGFDGPATEMQGSSDTQFNSSTLTISRQEPTRGTGMVILWTNGVLIEQLQDGVHEFNYNPDSLDNQSIALNVCSGEDGNSIDYDQPATRGTVTVAQNPEGGRLVQVHTETDQLDGAGIATGQVETADVDFTITR